MSVEMIGSARQPEYSIHFSNEDREWVATSSAYPSLSWLASTRREALAGLEQLIAEVEADIDQQAHCPGAEPPRCQHPTDAALACLRDFTGTPHEYVEFLESIWWTPRLMSVTEIRNRYGEKLMEVELVTGGWGGNETIVGEVERSLFSMAFWESSHRGGLFVYHVRHSMWDTWGEWGSLR